MVKWKSYSLKEATWQSEKDCENCPELIVAYRSSLLDKSLGGNVMNYISNSTSSLLAGQPEAFSLFQVKTVKGKVFIKAKISGQAVSQPPLGLMVKPSQVASGQDSIVKSRRLAVGQAATKSYFVNSIPKLGLGCPAKGKTALAV